MPMLFTENNFPTNKGDQERRHSLKAKFILFPISSGNKTAFCAKSVLPFQNETGSSKDLAFPITKETTASFEQSFPTVCSAVNICRFCCAKEKTTASQGFPTVRGLLFSVMQCDLRLLVSV